MSDDESPPSFLEEIRVKFVEEKVCALLHIQRQTWEKSAASLDFQSLLKDFFEKDRILYIVLSKKGGLVAAKEVWSSHKNISSLYYNKLACV